MNMIPLFSMTESWRGTYPGALAGILAVENVSNPAVNAELEQRKQLLESNLRAEFAGKSRADIEALPVMRAYDAYYKVFKKTYHVQLQLESIAFKGKPIPSVAALVEAMFMAEVKNRLLTAGHDLDCLQLPLTIQVAQGSEAYTLLRGQEQTLKARDMFISDQAGIISSIIYGPDQRTQITPTTTRALFTVYAPRGIQAQAVRAHLEELLGFIQVFAPTASAAALAVYPASKGTE
jgi:DNA/RNA-binding domain of Phe-tRNA-synthetase-like protein